MRHAHALLELLAPVVLVVAVALFGTLVSSSTQTYVITTLVNVSIVVALYVFIGNSGVLSFGHVSFVAVGAWTAGVLSMPVAEKPAIMPNLAAFLRDTTVGNVGSLAIAAGVGAAYALIVGLPLMRLSGLAAGIATFGVLEITHNVLRYWEKIGPGLNTFSAVPETTGLLQASLGLTIDAPGRKLHFKHPALPEWFGELSIRGLRVGDAELDLDVRRHARDVEINVVDREGQVRVIVTK